MASLLKDVWMRTCEIVRQKCAATQGNLLQNAALLGVIQYYITAEPYEQGLEKYFIAISLLSDTFQLPVNAEEDWDTVIKFVHRCIDVGESFGRPFERWLLSHIGLLVLEITVKDIRIGLHLADHLATTIDGLFDFQEVYKTHQIPHDLHESLGNLFECLIRVLAGARSIIFPVLGFTLDEGELLAVLLGDLNLVKKLARVLMQRLASITDQAVPQSQEIAYKHLTKLPMERLDRIENTFQIVKPTPGFYPTDISKTDTTVDARIALAQRGIFVLSDQTIMTRDIEEYIGSHAPPYSIDPPGDPADRCYTRFRRSESIPIVSEVSRTPTSDDHDDVEKSACAISIEVMNDAPDDIGHMNYWAADGVR